MITIFNEEGKTIGYDFAPNELEVIKANPDNAKLICDSFNKLQEEITSRMKNSETENTNRTKMMCDAQYQLITASSLGMIQ